MGDLVELAAQVAEAEVATARSTENGDQSADRGDGPGGCRGARAAHELFPPVDVEILDETNPRKPVTRMAKLLFTSGRGNPIQRTGWAYPWKKAVEAVDGVPEGFGYHGLRHYFATLLIHGGGRA